MPRFCTIHGNSLGEDGNCPSCAEMGSSIEKGSRSKQFVDFSKVAKGRKEFCQKCGEQRIDFGLLSCEFCDEPFPNNEILRIPLQQGLQSRMQVLSEAIYLGGIGANISPKTQGTLFMSEHLIGFRLPEGVLWSANPQAIEGLQIGGSGEFTTGGGWIGGGFGVKGALEGALFGGIMNALTTRTKFDCVMRVRFKQTDLTFQVLDRSPRQLTIDTTFLSHFLESNQSKNAQIQTAAEPITDSLRKLGELHDLGILTDEEFQAKKAELLRRL
jgi:Short C-terminal domain